MSTRLRLYLFWTTAVLAGVLANVVAMWASSLLVGGGSLLLVVNHYGEGWPELLVMLSAVPGTLILFNDSVKRLATESLNRSEAK